MWTPLMVSCFNGHLPIVEYLIENGADINQETQIGITSLAFAILNNQTEIAKFLLRNDVNTENTILGLQKHGELELIEILDKLYNKTMKE
jgi:ankyrin repeat protein